MRHEVAPKNIMMIGPTGVGKTEIARRLAKLTGAPFIKVEATKYTEVGYYGRDVESMVRELVENAIGIVRQRERKNVEDEARRRVENRLLDLLCPPPPGYGASEPADEHSDATQTEGDVEQAQYRRTRAKMRDMLNDGLLEDRRIEMTIEHKVTPVMYTGMGMEHMDIDLQGMFEKILPKNTTRRELTVGEARDVLFDQECEALLEPEKVNTAAIELAENLGIIFIDEIDKVVASESKGADVSRQGVQRDLLPIVEGTTIQTRYGYVRTDHVLFVAAGAFHRSKPSELMPELHPCPLVRPELPRAQGHTGRRLQGRHLPGREDRGGQSTRNHPALQGRVSRHAVLLFQRVERDDLQQEAVGRRRGDGLREEAGWDGPYIFKERQLGRYVLYERAPTPHWKHGTVDWKEIQMTWMLEEPTRFAQTPGRRDPPHRSQSRTSRTSWSRRATSSSAAGHRAADADQLRRPVLRHRGQGHGALYGARRHHRETGPEGALDESRCGRP